MTIAARKGDPVALAAFDSLARWLGQGHRRCDVLAGSGMFRHRWRREGGRRLAARRDATGIHVGAVRSGLPDRSLRFGSRRWATRRDSSGLLTLTSLATRPRRDGTVGG